MLTVGAVTPSITNVTYQWQESSNNDDWNDISGATTNQFTLTSAQHKKYVRVEVTRVGQANEQFYSNSTGIIKAVFISRGGVALGNKVNGISMDALRQSIASTTVTITTNAGNFSVNVDWNHSVLLGTYNPASTDKFEKEITGTVRLPADVVNPKGVSLNIASTIRVNAK